MIKFLSMANYMQKLEIGCIQSMLSTECSRVAIDLGHIFMRLVGITGEVWHLNLLRMESTRHNQSFRKMAAYCTLRAT